MRENNIELDIVLLSLGCQLCLCKEVFDDKTNLRTLFERSEGLVDG